ncbi:VOC family protein [Phyllobacterium sp. YR531]|uniref:VOC family protein n=1 Tax=Phyllobacterium sp. YR531 TaxID=1144343 RepID=UPI00026F7EE8|nr:VOC family protein [Phyllobacterium sp. YR531]EJM98920.1 lactoylglutathione lyase family protein [Phyllobacterium sp. YR531]
MSGSFIWYELLTSDAQAAEAFYTYVVGWGAEDSVTSPFRYRLLTVDKAPVAGLMSAKDAQVEGVPPMWSGYVMVDDVPAYVERVKQAGGKVHTEIMDIPEVGTFVVVADPLGAPFQLFKPARTDRGGYPPPFTPGTIGWHELVSDDAEKALAFYASLFGWTKGEAMDMGPMGTYQIFNVDGQMYGGMMTSTDTSDVKLWRFYFIVDDIDTAVARIKEKGGQVTTEPMEVPGDAWIIEGRDPQGAYFALTGPRK